MVLMDYLERLNYLIQLASCFDFIPCVNIFDYDEAKWEQEGDTGSFIGYGALDNIEGGLNLNNSIYDLSESKECNCFNYESLSSVNAALNNAAYKFDNLLNIRAVTLKNNGLNIYSCENEKQLINPRLTEVDLIKRAAVPFCYNGIKSNNTDEAVGVDYACVDIKMPLNFSAAEGDCLFNNLNNCYSNYQGTAPMLTGFNKLQEISCINNWQKNILQNSFLPFFYNKSANVNYSSCLSLYNNYALQSGREAFVNGCTENFNFFADDMTNAFDKWVNISDRTPIVYNKMDIDKCIYISKGVKEDYILSEYKIDELVGHNYCGNDYKGGKESLRGDKTQSITVNVDFKAYTQGGEADNSQGEQLARVFVKRLKQELLSYGEGIHL